MWGCSATTSHHSMQSGKLIKKGEFEYSAYNSFPKSLGTQIAYGIDKKTNLIFELNYLYASNQNIWEHYESDDGDDETINHPILLDRDESVQIIELSLGLKYQSIKKENRFFSLYCPFNLNIDSKKSQFRSTVIKPGFIATFAVGENKNIEFSHSQKLLIPLNNPKYFLYSMSYGSGFIVRPYRKFLNNRHKWVIRSEFNFLFIPSYNIHYNIKTDKLLEPTFSIGFSVNL